ncbi:MAG: hypothetical protein AVDCRST_MAG77-386, partial [uncultured Chloroflexi bacterium]
EVHHRAQGPLGGRADLPGAAGRPEQLLRRRQTARFSTPPSRRGAPGRHPAG